MRIINPPPYNEDLFFRLLAILDYCYSPTRAVKRGFNDTAIVRALGISRRTLDKMRNEGDQWPWWPSVMRDAISWVLPSLPKFKRRNVAKMLRRLPEEYAEQIEFANEARDYVLDHLANGPALSSELLSTANRGNISEARIKRAARQLGVIKKREGKAGKDHMSVWSLPRWDESDVGEE